ncbi:hypothetical protein GCM10022261_26370 [Brevibacterium daeguense]|uniref:Phosphodiesterase n=2 Tax=Brevibacterium daeguense TaxID=909936 RepID=A0ABP8EMB0_9MICO
MRIGCVRGLRHNGTMSLPHSLVTDLQAAGYYPQLAGSMLVESLFDEEVVSHLVHMDTHVDLDSIHRHVTAFIVTPTRLLLTHVDDEPDYAPGQRPRGMTSTEDIPLERLRTVLIGRTYENPAQFRPGDRPVEVSMTLGWGSVRRIEAFPETCGDPDCEGDHGYGGSLYSEDVTLRVSAQAEGQKAVDQAEEFALRLRRAVFEARRQAVR